MSAEDMAILRKAAERGDAEAQCAMGMVYEAGLDNEKGPEIEKDIAEAIKWFKKSAAQGLTQAKFKLGSIYSSEASNKRLLLFETLM